MDQPRDFVQEHKEDLICKLKQILNMLKQSPRTRYHCIDYFFLLAMVFLKANQIIRYTSNKQVNICKWQFFTWMISSYWQAM